MSTAKLHRHITLLPLVLYGVGDILGAGIYGLVGKAAGHMGNGVWLAFLISMCAAAFTGLSYASLGSRYPRAGGAAYVTHKAYGSSFFAYLIGLAVLASGLTSMGAASQAFAGYFTALFPTVSSPVVVVGFAFLLAAIIFIGIRETLWVNNTLAIVELGGLAVIIVLGISFLGEANYLDLQTPQNPTGDWSFALLFGGAVLTFYSFVGFEDILNVSEEVKDPNTTIPRGLILAVAIASSVYMLISIIAVSVVPAAELATSKQPLVEVVKRAAPWFPLPVYSVISLLAVSNTALLNYVMGSRLLYGMSKQGLMPKFLSGVHDKRATPHRAVGVLLVLLLILALSGDISTLARATSVLMLMCFCAVNSALIVLQRKDPQKGEFEVPMFVPAVGVIFCLAILSQASKDELMVSGIILALITGLYFLIRPSAEAVTQMEA